MSNQTIILPGKLHVIQWLKSDSLPFPFLPVLAVKIPVSKVEYILH